MKYFLIEIATGDNKIAGKSIYEYETRNEALANFHSKLGTAMKSALYETEQILVINSANGIEASETYAKPVPEVEEETVEE